MSERAQETTNFILDGFEERADHISESTLLSQTVTTKYYDNIHTDLTSQGLVLLEGPRGSGKTHMMRYTWVMCRNDKNLPLALYVSFNRYLRLEPLLKRRADALSLFQTWVLSRILQSADDLSRHIDFRVPYPILDRLRLNRDDIDMLVTHLERGQDITSLDERIVQNISIEKIAKEIEDMSAYYGRKRAIILLDDAALTLTPEFLIELFDIIRVIKRPKISPKASVYPGTTEYGPRFHATHEGKRRSCWLSVDHESYKDIMNEIALKRFSDSVKVPDNVKDILMYASFGIPRAFLFLLREWISSDLRTEQQKLNQIIQVHNEARMQEFRSLSLKTPRLKTLIDTGVVFFNYAIDELTSANQVLVHKKEKQIMYGIEEDGINSLIERMINLVIEAGLFFEHPKVSHGEERKYRRFTPHLSALIENRAFADKSKRGSSLTEQVSFIERSNQKHPVRRKISSIFNQDQLSSLQLDLPACQECQTPRIDEGQKFCHNCGAHLIDDSTYSRCMQLGFEDVPGITEWMRNQLSKHHIQTIGGLLGLQDPGTELRKIYMVGEKRAEKAVIAIESYVNEFLS